MQVAICMPHLGLIKAQTVQSLVKLFKNIKVDWRVLMAEGCILHVTRERLCKRAVELGCSHVLFVDSDMSFEPEVLDKLLARDKDIIGVLCNTRSEDKKLTVKIHDENGNIIKEIDDSGLMKCAAVGTGFVLIKTEVFKKLPHPWFFWESDEDGECKTGEDMWFCNLARKNGFEIYCDCTIEIGHVGDKVF